MYLSPFGTTWTELGSCFILSTASPRHVTATAYHCIHHSIYSPLSFSAKTLEKEIDRERSREIEKGRSEHWWSRIRSRSPCRTDRSRRTGDRRTRRRCRRIRWWRPSSPISTSSPWPTPIGKRGSISTELCERWSSRFRSLFLWVGWWIWCPRDVEMIDLDEFGDLNCFDLLARFDWFA